jgi:branched-chain amino acid transport system permease protein
MLQYVLAGLALGSIYAIAASSLAVTFISSGVMNFAFSGMAYVVARFYYLLNSQHHWGTDTAGAFAILVFAPAVGVILYFALFQFLRGKSTLIKLVTTIALSVGLPAVADLTMGTQAITTAPGLAAINDQPHHWFGTAITNDNLITYVFLMIVVVGGLGILRFTQVGLKVRAMVDSEALSGLSGVNPGRVSFGVWAVSGMLAGIAGILVAPTNGLNPYGMFTLMAAAFTAVVVARLRSLGGAVAAAMAMGLVTDVIQKYVPTTSSFTAAVIPSIPFAFVAIALLVYAYRQVGNTDDGAALGPLDQAIRPARQATRAGTRTYGWRGPTTLIGLAPMVAIAILPLLFKGSPYWLGLIAVGVCYSIAFLGITVVTGEGGMLWLSQITFAGAGAIVAAQITTQWGWPVLPAIVVAAAIVGVAGALLGLLTVRFGDLYVALGTLTFGLLIENLVFTRQKFAQSGLGVVLNRPGFASSDLKFTYLGLVVFAIFALLIINLRNSTTGMAMRAVRDSQTAARTVGLSVVQMKVVVGALGAFVAAVGGAFLAMYAGYAQPGSFQTLEGLVWLVVVASLGIRLITAAAIAGLSFSLLPGVFSTYVPTRWAEVPTLLFSVGAIGLARNPDGALMQGVYAVRGLLRPKATADPLSQAAPAASPAPAAAPTTISLPTTESEPQPTQPAGRHRKVRS